MADACLPAIVGDPQTRRALFAAALLWTACGGEPQPATVETPLTPPQMPARLTLRAADTSLSDRIPAYSLAGWGTAYVGAFQLHESVGTIEMMGRTLPAVVVAESAFSEQAIILHQIYALSDDGFFVVWTYCSAGTIDLVYILDSRDGSGRFDGASGTCDDVQRASATPVRFPGADLPWPRVHTGFEVNGRSLQLHAAAPGAVHYGGTVRAAVPFAVIDCSLCDAKGGWYELHSLLWDPGNGSVVLGIFYLIAKDDSHVLFEYAIDLGTLQRVTGATYAADWTLTPF
jgi:hypothetical protein